MSLDARLKKLERGADEPDVPMNIGRLLEIVTGEVEPTPHELEQLEAIEAQLQDVKPEDIEQELDRLMAEIIHLP